ncbi:MAG: hypothetical protein EOP67_63715, partial [Sphingomonas sp.]
PLNQITPENVGKLERVWSFHTGDLPGDRPGAQNKYASENTPLKIGDTLYACTGKNMVVAVNAATGQVKWRFDPGVDDAAIPYTAACRGVSYYVVPSVAATDPCATRIIWGTLDARIVAVDARTGQRCQGFGQNGQVNTAEGMGPTVPGMISEYGVPKKTVSLVPFFALAGTVTGSVLWGWIADVYGRKASILLSAVMFVGTSICGAMPRISSGCWSKAASA